MLNCFSFLSPLEMSSTAPYGHGKEFALAKPNYGGGGLGTEITP